jgi:hypothetical protein
MMSDTSAADLSLTGARVIPWKDELPAGFVPVRVVFGRDDIQVGEVQVAVATSSVRPNKGMLEAAHKKRAANTAMPVILAIVHADGVWLFDGDEPLGPVPLSQAERQLQAVLDEPHGIAAAIRIKAIRAAYTSLGMKGFSNQFLFATYHLRVNVPRRTDWEQARLNSEPKLAKRGKELITALGFEVEPAYGVSQNVLVLRGTSGSRRAIAVLLDESENFGQKSASYQLSPEAKALEVASREEVPWVIGLRQSTLRLYPGRDGVGVGQRGQSETYFELDLAFVDPEFAGLLDLIFSAQALEKGGTTEEILDGSGRYAADLGARLRDRVYLGVVPRLAIAVAERLPSLDIAVDAEGLQVAYRLSMRILFRLLFQAYGEATELLPAGRNEHYDANSLRTFVSRELKTNPDDFAEAASSIWRDLTQVWDAIAQGNPRWEIPAYGGSLFDPLSEEGKLLERLQLPDSTLGPALQAMLTEVTEDGVPGAVDFRSLQVREFGTIYEGLLESSLSLAEGDLTIDRAGIYVPAGAKDNVIVRAGEPYFHSASGERKATGSYYTPKVVVDHLVDRSVRPALESHLARVRDLMDQGRDREAGEVFFDFRVADLAMGSGHFLVAAVDKIERGMRDFLTVNPVTSVRSELQRLAVKAREALGADTLAAEGITEAQLLRRQVARRCLYGLDINPLAVELSRLALWIHTFVPGLPMSSLDHGLVLANSLTGIGTIDEAIAALDATALFEPIILEPLAAAHELLKDYARASEADKSEVARGAEVLALAAGAAAPARAVFDLALAKRLGIPVGDAWDSEQFVELASDSRVLEVVDRLRPAHMPYLFPEVFLRENPGFDALVGNPPWEKVKVEEHQWWGLHVPRLRAMPQQQKIPFLAAFRNERRDLEAQFQKELSTTDSFRSVLVKGPYPGLGAGDPDLYQAFAWRFWQLLRAGGRFSVVLPRGALGGKALSSWRTEIATMGTFVEVNLLENKNEWVFHLPNGTRLTIALVVAERGGDHSVSFNGPFLDEGQFLGSRDRLVSFSSADFLSWSETAAFPSLADHAAAEVFAQISSHPGALADRPDFAYWPFRELDSSLDKSLYVFTDKPPTEDFTPILTGASFSLWNPNFGEPYAWADRAGLRKHLGDKLKRAVANSRSAHFGLDYREDALPLDEARIAFRDIVRSTDSRTSIACLIPPGSATVEMAPTLVRKRGDSTTDAYLLGFLSSIPFDWIARKWVEGHMKFGVLAPLPVPILDRESNLGARISEVSGRLAATDDRFKDWASDLGVPVGAASEESIKFALVSELDALVSISYGLSRKQVEHVFETFHRGWDYTPRLESVLEYFDQWKDAS